MTRLFPVIAATLLATTVLAQSPVCRMEGAEMFPILEESKALFLKGDFRGYLATVDTFFPDLDYGPLFEPLSALAPDGFDGCTTIAQRVDTGGMVQEITLFDLPGDQGPLSLYMAAGPVEGELTVLLFSFNGKLSVILDKLR